MWNEFKKITLLNWKNTLVIDTLAVVLFFVIRSLPNLEMFAGLAKTFGFFSSSFWKITLKFLGGTFSSSHLAEVILIALLSILTAINIVVFVVFFKRQRRLLSGRNATLSLGGMVLGLFGAGCISCGTLLLAPLISFLGLGAFFDKLPLNGIEVSLIGLVLITVSIIIMLRKLSQPVVCEV